MCERAISLSRMLRVQICVHEKEKKIDLLVGDRPVHRLRRQHQRVPTDHKVPAFQNFRNRKSGLRAAFLDQVVAAADVATEPKKRRFIFLCYQLGSIARTIGVINGLRVQKPEKSCQQTSDCLNFKLQLYTGKKSYKGFGETYSSYYMGHSLI